MVQASKKWIALLKQIKDKLDISYSRNFFLNIETFKMFKLWMLIECFNVSIIIQIKIKAAVISHD